MENIHKFQLTRKKDGSQILIDLETGMNKFMEPWHRAKFGEAYVTVGNTVQGPAIAFEAFELRKHRKEIEAAFGFKWDGKARIQILIESALPFESVVKAWENECKRMKDERQALIEAQPRILGIHNYCDYGDYSITLEHRIVELRAAMKDEEPGWYFLRNVAVLDGRKIEGLRDEWAAAWEAADPVHCNSYVVSHQPVRLIKPEDAVPFIRQAEGISERELQEKTARDAKAAAARIAEEQRQANIEAGAIYFHCESAPHDEDLSGVILNRPAPNGGLFILTHRVPADIFNQIKPFGAYWDRDWLEECDMFTAEPGWRFSAKAVQELARTNRVFVNGKEIEK